MTVANMIEQDMQTNDFWSGIAKIEFITAINKIMTENNISKSDLARAINKSPAYITKVMSGDVNLTIESMVMFARAVGATYHPSIHPERPKGKNIVQTTIRYQTKMAEPLVVRYAQSR